MTKMLPMYQFYFKYYKKVTYFGLIAFSHCVTMTSHGGIATFALNKCRVQVTPERINTPNIALNRTEKCHKFSSMAATLHGSTPHRQSPPKHRNQYQYSAKFLLFLKLQFLQTTSKAACNDIGTHILRGQSSL